MTKSKIALPADLLAFLAAGRKLQYDAKKCECGRVTLLKPRQLRLKSFTVFTDEMQEVYGDPRHDKGHYIVPAVNLVATCEHYEPLGILIWIPKEKMFGTWDDDHHVVKVLTTFRTRGDTAGIEAANWGDIQTDPARFLNSQWGRDHTTSKLLIPWPKYSWKPGLR